MIWKGEGWEGNYWDVVKYKENVKKISNILDAPLWIVLVCVIMGYNKEFSNIVRDGVQGQQSNILNQI